MNEEKDGLLNEKILDTKMCKYKLVFLAVQYTRILKKKKNQEFKNTYFLTRESILDILSKKVNQKEIRSGLEGEKKNKEESSQKEPVTSKK